LANHTCCARHRNTRLEVLSVANTGIGEIQGTEVEAVLRANRFIPIHDTILICYRDTEGGGPHEQLLKERQTLARLFDCQCCECTGKCGPKQSGGAQNTPVPASIGRDDHKRKPCTPFTVPRRYETMPRRVEQLSEDVPQARHTQRAGSTRQVKRKAGRAAGPKTAPSLLHIDEFYAGIDHDMGTTLTNEGHSNSAVDTSGSAHGTVDSGRTETNWSGNGTSGGTSNPETGGETKIATMAFVTNHSPCPDNARDRFYFLILVAFITGNSSLEPLIEGLYAQIHVNLR